MHGLGMYIYNDGTIYSGQYKEDKKHGFGIYNWPDGRRYKGWWHEGKQHGLGQYFDVTKNSEKSGLWENGKRIAWFNPQQIELINSNQYSYEKEFTEESSKNKSTSKPQTFNGPKNFIK